MVAALGVRPPMLIVCHRRLQIAQNRRAILVGESVQFRSALTLWRHDRTVSPSEMAQPSHRRILMDWRSPGATLGKLHASLALLSAWEGGTGYTMQEPPDPLARTADVHQPNTISF